MARTVALIGSLAFICLLAALTISVAVDEGVDILVIVSLINVTLALRASSLPWTVMFAVSVIWVRAKIVPTKVKPVFCRNAD